VGRPLQRRVDLPLVGRPGDMLMARRDGPMRALAVLVPELRALLSDLDL
jgi:hypothetical protein